MLLNDEPVTIEITLGDDKEFMHSFTLAGVTIQINQYSMDCIRTNKTNMINLIETITALTQDSDHAKTNFAMNATLVIMRMNAVLYAGSRLNALGQPVLILQFDGEPPFYKNRISDIKAIEQALRLAK